MIKRFSTYCLAVVLLLAVCFDAHAQGGAAVVIGVTTVKKNVTQTFVAPKNGALMIYNNYGDVRIKTWNRKTILVKVSISASSSDAKKAAELLKSVHIDFAKVADSISCIAAIGTPVKIRAMNQPDTGQGSRPITITLLPAKWCTLNFQVYLPATQALHIENMFGNVTVGDYAGPLNISEKFGDITAGNLSGPVHFTIQQGNLNIDRLNLGDLNVKTFDHVKIGNMSGRSGGQFQFGRQLDIKLARLPDSINLKANNVAQVNVSGVNPIHTRYNLQLVFTKLSPNNLSFTPNNKALKFKALNLEILKRDMQHLDDSVMAAHPELKISPKDTKTSADSLKLKHEKQITILTLAKFKQVHEYQAGPENAKSKVVIKVDFGTLNLRE
jgi:hypothetical protein